MLVSCKSPSVWPQTNFVELFPICILNLIVRWSIHMYVVHIYVVEESFCRCLNTSFSRATGFTVRTVVKNPLDRLQSIYNVYMRFVL